MPTIEYKQELDSHDDSQGDEASNLIINYLPVDLDEMQLKVVTL